MKKILKLNFIFILFSIAFILNNTAFAQSNLPKLFLFLGGDQANLHEKELKNSCVYGAQIIYSWRLLEPKKGVYDFSKIKQDLLYLNKAHKKIFIQIQDRSFDPNVFNVPNYIREDESYHGGVARQYDFPGEGKPITTGWVARVWDPAVRKRFQLLMKELASQFDGRIYGINLPETAVDFDEHNPPQGFDYDKYFSSELENIAVLRKVFHKSIVMQYVNFFPGEWNNDHRYMSRLFSYAKAHNIGLGGPDVLPYRKAHMENSYPFFHEYKDKLLTGMAIQEPDYTYKNPETGQPYTFSDFYHFSRDYLGANILFWNIQQPFFSEQLSPELRDDYFECLS
jgi:hypothetical protein